MTEIKKVFYVPTVFPEDSNIFFDANHKPAADAEYSFSIEDNTLVLNAKMSDGITEQLSLNINDNLGSALNWMRAPVYEGYTTYVDPILGSFGKTSYQMRRDTTQLAKIVIEPDGGIILALLCRCEQPCDDAEVISKKSREGLANFLCSKSDWLKEQYAGIKKKVHFLREIDSYDTLSYLEAQVDLLTRIVVSCADYLTDKTTLTDSEATTLFSALKTADASSVLNVKPMEKMTAEFTENKAGFRAKQEVYFNE